MSSLTNFLLSIYIARTLGAAQFGAFTLAYVTYGFAINASRGLSIEPLLIRFSGTSLTDWRRATAGSTGTALVVGSSAGACALAAGPLIGGTTGTAFVALGLTLPGLMLQDAGGTRSSPWDAGTTRSSTTRPGRRSRSRPWSC